jgi:hypothetical protein
VTADPTGVTRDLAEVGRLLVAAQRRHGGNDTAIHRPMLCPKDRGMTNWRRAQVHAPLSLPPPDAALRGRALPGGGTRGDTGLALRDTATMRSSWMSGVILPLRRASIRPPLANLSS